MANKSGWDSKSGWFYSGLFLVLAAILTLTYGDITDQCVKLTKTGNPRICNACKANNDANVTTTRTPATTAAPQPPPKSIRLPTALRPLHYDLEMFPQMYIGPKKDFVVEGKVTIKVDCKEDIDRITLRLSTAVDIDNMTVEFRNVNPQPSDPKYSHVSRDTERHFLVIHLTDKMKNGNKYIVSIEFKSPLNSEPSTFQGLLLSNYKSKSYNKTRYFAHYYGALVRDMWPSFGDSALKATVTVKITREKSYKSYSSMPLLKSSLPWIRNGTELVTDTFQTTDPIETNSVSFQVNDLDFIEDYAGTVQLRVFAVPDYLNKMQYVLNLTKQLLPYYEMYFDQKFPLPKLDTFAIPAPYQGISAWGVSIYGQSYVAFEPGKTSLSDQKTAALIVAHETIHQWFGNLVGPSWYDESWIGEAFAEFMAYVALEEKEPSFKAFDSFPGEVLEPALTEDSKITSVPIFRKIETQADMDRPRNMPILYSKSTSILRMLYQAIGPETFRKGVARFIAKYKFSSASHKDLWNSIQEQVNQDNKTVNVTEMMDTFVLQMNYPVLTVIRDPNNHTKVQVTQKRFLSNPKAVDPMTYKSPFGYTWTLPVSLTSSREKKFKQTDKDLFWLNNERNDEQSFQVNNLPDYSDPKGWILANTERIGFYRVNYDEKNWNALIEQLSQDHKSFPVITRAQLINDAITLAEAKELDLVIALKTTKFLKRELDSIPWYGAEGIFDSIDSRIMGLPIYGMFQKFMRDILAYPYSQYGIHNRKNSTTEEKSARTVIARLACQHDLEECVVDAQLEYAKFMKNPKNYKINPDLEHAIQCAAIRHGGWKEYRFAEKMYEESSDYDLQTDMLNAMACSSNFWILKHYFEPPGINSTKPWYYSFFKMGIALESPLGRQLSWQHFQENVEELKKRDATPYGYLDSYYESFAKIFYTQFQLDQFIAFWDLKKDTLTFTTYRDTAVEIVKSNIQWMKSNYRGLKDWLTDNYSL